MKKRAIIYTRVSTDEQNNGYSPSDQKDKIYKYCENQDIEIVGFYHDDESGKSFNRPEWKNIIQFIKKNKNYVDNILFLKWDRFSRNVAEAYIAIRDLKKLGVEPQSIEQPLDLEIPESKLMLAVYLAAPEVDNDRRTLNIFHGIRRAKKEGRWLGKCLKGYKNVRDENNKPIIRPEGGAQEALIKKAFAEFATGLYNIEELRKKLNKEGLKATRNSFWMMLRNKGYIGKVFVDSYKDEEAYWTEGQHAGIIEEDTFFIVQDILEGRKKKLPNKALTKREELPLRGFLECPRCGRTLTGSASTGRAGGKFFYYHCSFGCKERQKAKELNMLFTALLQNYTANHSSMKLFSAILKDKLSQSSTKGKTEIDKIESLVLKNKTRLKNAKDMMLDGEFSSAEYKEMKLEIENTLDELKREELRLTSDLQNHTSKVDKCLELLLNLSIYYSNSSVDVKQQIIGSIFPEKLIFEKNSYRTPKINRVVSLICSNTKGIETNKKGKKHQKDVSSLGVLPPGIEPGTY